MAVAIGPVAVPLEPIYWSPKTLTPEFRNLENTKLTSITTLAQVALQHQRAAYNVLVNEKDVLGKKCTELVSCCV